MSEEPNDLDGGVVEQVESFLLGEAPSLTRLEVAEQAGQPVEVCQELWRLLGFPETGDDDVAFTPGDVEAVKLAGDLMALGILSPERQAALVRTWGRSFARLAEWQTTLLADVATESGEDPATQVTQLATEVLPRVDKLQDYVWRRHLASAAGRLLGVTDGEAATQAVGFVDIVGFTSRSKELSESELVTWIERFESAATEVVSEHGGRIIKSIGDAVLFVADDLDAALDAALTMTERGADDDDDFPAVRAGIAYGEVVPRLGDVFGPTVNIASRLTSVARPGTVLLDQGGHDAMHGDPDEVDHAEHDRRAADAAYDLKRLRRTSVKGYAKLRSWVVRRR